MAEVGTGRWKMEWNGMEWNGMEFTDFPRLKVENGMENIG